MQRLKVYLVLYLFCAQIKVLLNKDHKEITGDVDGKLVSDKSLFSHERDEQRKCFVVILNIDKNLIQTPGPREVLIFHLLHDDCRESGQLL